MSTMLYLLIGTISTNILQNIINDLAKISTSPKSPLRNQWVQTFIVCLLVIAVFVGSKSLVMTRTMIKTGDDKNHDENR
jgi:hypothetical protein